MSAECTKEADARKCSMRWNGPVSYYILQRNLLTLLASGCIPRFFHLLIVRKGPLERPVRNLCWSSIANSEIE